MHICVGGLATLTSVVNLCHLVSSIQCCILRFGKAAQFATSPFVQHICCAAALMYDFNHYDYGCRLVAVV